VLYNCGIWDVSHPPPSAFISSSEVWEPWAHDFNIAELIQRTGGAYALYMRLSVPHVFCDGRKRYAGEFQDTPSA
jgi:hypothetical protein